MDNNSITHAIDGSAKECPTAEEQLITSDRQSSLTTTVTQVLDEDMTEIEDDINNDNNICKNVVIFENTNHLANSDENNETIVGHKQVVNEEVNQNISENERKYSEIVSKLQKDSKYVSNKSKEKNKKRKMSRKMEKSDKMYDKVMKQLDKQINNECLDTISNMSSIMS